MYRVGLKLGLGLGECGFYLFSLKLLEKFSQSGAPLSPDLYCIHQPLANSSQLHALLTDMSIGCLSVILNIGVGMTQSEVAVDALSLLHAAGDGGG